MRLPGVLKIHVVREGGHHYYVQDLVPGRAEGTLGGRRGAGGVERGRRWLARAGRPGEAGDFAEVLAGRDPVLGPVPCGPGGDRSVAGYDLTFCAPKSVSLLHLLDPGRSPPRPGPATRRRWPMPSATSSARRHWPSAVGARVGRPAPLTGRGGRGGSSTGPAGPSIPTSTPTWWWPTWPRGWTASGRRWTAGGSTPISRPPRGSTTPDCGSSSATALGASWEVGPSGLGDVVGVHSGLRRLFSQRGRHGIASTFVRPRYGRTGRHRPTGAFHADPAGEGGRAHRRATC